MGVGRCARSSVCDEKPVGTFRNMKKSWRTRFGFYLAAIGSAFGLGSLWRFPYVVAENGGGAFVLLYLSLVVLIGFPLLVGELMVGRVSRKSVIAAPKVLSAQSVAPRTFQQQQFLRWMPYLGALSVVVCVLILGYYSVISGWVLFDLGKIVEMAFADSTASASGHVVIVKNSSNEMWMEDLLKSGALQWGLAVGHLLVATIVVAKGFEDGIERVVGLIMPLFVVILGFLIFRSLNLPSSTDAMRFFLYPDFSKLTASSLSHAVGQLCFTLSIGVTTMMTFGSYLKPGVLAPQTGFRVTALDSATAVLGGFLIFPLVVTSAAQVEKFGLDTLFRAVPPFLLNLESGLFVSGLFFVCLYLAALGATLSLIETIVSNLCENSNLTRAQACAITGVLAAGASVLPALSSNAFGGVVLFGKSVIEYMDLVLINWIVPLLALAYSQIVVYAIPRGLKRKEFSVELDPGNQLIFDHWQFLLKWIVPIVIGGGLLLQILGVFTFASH